MKKLIIILSCCTLVLLTGYVSYRGYKGWKQQHLMTMARTFLSKSDERNAVLCLQLVLTANPRNLDATRMMANLMTSDRSPSALLWRSRLVDLNPNSLEARLALVEAALTFHDYAMAVNALEGVNDSGKKTAKYNMVAGAVAVARNDLAQAEVYFLEAARLDPTNQVSRLNLAMVRLHGSNTLDMAEARIVLQRIISESDKKDLRCQAIRELVIDATRFQQTNTALALSKELLSDTNSVFADRVLRLRVLRGTQAPEFNTALDQFRQEAAQDPAKIYELASWEISALPSPRGTLDWLLSLPSSLKTNVTVMLTTADCYSVLKDWRGLQTAIEHQDWHDLEFIRYALKTRALRGQDLAGASKSEWELALKAADYDKSRLRMLLYLAVQWKWQNEAEEILWAVVNRYPEETWAVPTLAQALYAHGRTRPLMLLFGQQVRRFPADLEAKNNLAVTALLLDAQELKPHDLAREVYQRAPGNASYASTYAFSLYVQKRNAEALKVLEKLRPQELQKPSISGYYGLILKATGDLKRAQHCLEAASKAPLLPEERQLFSRALVGV
jgi:predicted Zn-dependent protease